MQKDNAFFAVGGEDDTVAFVAAKRERLEVNDKRRLPAEEYGRIGKIFRDARHDLPRLRAEIDGQL